MKRKVLFFIVWFILILLMGVFFGYINTLDSWLHWVLSVALLIILVLPTYYTQFHKIPLALNEEELREPVIEHQDFSNSNVWYNYVLVVLIAVLMPSWVFVANITEMYLNGKSWDSIWAFEISLITGLSTSITWWILWITVIVIWLRTTMRNARNKYIIDGDTLIIQENFIAKTEEEIRIPIACIDEVYTASNWSPNPILWIKVNGVTRRCYAFPHSLELGKAILRHKHALQQQD